MSAGNKIFAAAVTAACALLGMSGAAGVAVRGAPARGRLPGRARITGRAWLRSGSRAADIR
jgi:hypothetical protein